MQKLNALLAKYPGFTHGVYGAGSTHLQPDTVRSDAATMAQEGRNLRVGIIGRVKAGKSSLLNALLFDGKDVLPKAATPMTASLTVLGYADTPRAEVEFFTQEDIENMRKLAGDYDREFDRLVQEKLEKAQIRPAGLGARPAQAIDPERIAASVRRELDANPVLGGAKDLYESIKRIQQSGGLPTQKSQPIAAKNIEDLQGKLGDYVGANGKFTPFTKCLSIFLPLPALRDLEVVDTPGVNDPIVSRESRTYEELHRCDVVFVVSPSGQFLNMQDLELMDRLVSKDGVEEVFLVASQIDAQMFSSEHKRHCGRLPDVLQGLRQTLAQQARHTLGARTKGSKGLDTLKRELDTRLVVTSSVAYVLATQPESDWDANTRHIQQMLGKFYRTEFAQPEIARPHLNAIAGIVQTTAMMNQVRERKQAITTQKLGAFLDAQAQTLQKCLAHAPQVVSKNREKVEITDGEALEQQLKSIQQVSKKGACAANAAVGTVAQSVADALRNHMDAEVEKLVGELTSQAERAQGTTTRTYTVEKSGALSWLARKTGMGGTEERSETVNTIDATAVRNALQEVHYELSNRLIRTVEAARKGLRPELERSILRELRENQVVNDRDIDTALLAQSCQAAMANLRDFDDPELPALPDTLLQSGTLKGGAAGRYDTEAREYFPELQKAAKAAARKLTKDFEDRLESAEVGITLFEQYQERIQELKKQIKDKVQTLKHYDNLLAELKELQRHE
ncbi:MAG: dynamin family protein [Burkholderiaceae bacterium]|nr:dynamin family protein [Burkholderiaceae bacterium]